jgi:hypothetical protein
MEQCPICYSELEVKDCTPCDDCGCNPDSVENFGPKKKKYTTYDILGIEQLTLCNFCYVDFGPYLPEFFGTNSKRIGLRNFEFVQEYQNLQITKDKVCPTCNRRLKFLNFIIKVREKST